MFIVRVYGKQLDVFLRPLRAATACGEEIELISLDHDAGAEYVYGGDYIQVLLYLEWLYIEKGIEVCTNFHIHTANPVGAQNMRSIIKHGGWTEYEDEYSFF